MTAIESAHASECEPHGGDAREIPLPTETCPAFVSGTGNRDWIEHGIHPDDANVFRPDALNRGAARNA